MCPMLEATHGPGVLEAGTQQVLRPWHSNKSVCDKMVWAFIFKTCISLTLVPGLGGKGGPYRLDAGHDVHQLSDEEKADVPEEVTRAGKTCF